MGQRKTAFLEKELPKTIRDAITVTRRLGMQYLWVDALCILQGTDPRAREGWSMESAKMNYIYGGASLTIATASAKSVHDGIFDLYQPQPAPSAVKIRLFSRKRALSSRSLFASRLLIANTHKEPLYHRGWTLQERVLSPRVVVYTRQQLLWECQTTHLTQKGMPMVNLHKLRLPDNCSARELRNRWRVIVIDSSARDLSSPTDKLPALSGLAQAFHAKMPGNKYLAGLWEASILEDLLWCHRPVSTGRRAKRARPSGYRAPSWSWASVDGNVRWPFILGIRGHAYVDSEDVIVEDWTSEYLSDTETYWTTTTESSDSWESDREEDDELGELWNNLEEDEEVDHPPQTWASKAEVLGSWTALSGSDPFGEITDGRIIMKGPLQRLEPVLYAVRGKGIVFFLDHSDGFEDNMVDMVPDEGRTYVMSPSTPSSLQRLAQFNKVHLLCISASVALVLLPAEEKILGPRGHHKYKRVGIASVKGGFVMSLLEPRFRWITTVIEIL